MNIDVIWDTPDQKIIRLIFQRRWTREGFYAALQEAHALLERAQQPTHIVIDYSGANIPASVFLAQAKSLHHLAAHPNASACVVVGATEETRALCETVSYRNTLCHPFRFVDTLDDAYAVLSQLDFVAGLNNLLGDWPRTSGVAASSSSG